MDRRAFLAASGVGAAALAASKASAQGADSSEYYELRKYHMRSGDASRPLESFLRTAAIPALNRVGVEPVGVFKAAYGDGSLSLYVLLTHPNIESVVTAGQQILDDNEYMDAGGEFLNMTLDDPGYVRYESSLMRAFAGMPKIEAPGGGSRIFELRRYESHSEKAAKKKIEMFNEGGEIQIFRDTGLHPVFFGESLIGSNLPNLTYMLTFKDMAERDANWKTFVSSDAWKKLSGDAQYKDTVSNIEDTILRPTGYSQV